MKALNIYHVNLILLLYVGCSSSRIHEDEYGLGVANHGTENLRAVSVNFDGQVFSYGGVGSGNQSINVGGLYLKEGKKYPPVILEYGLLDDYPEEKSVVIDWDGVPLPKGFVPVGEYPVLMINVFPGIEGKPSTISWRE